MQSEANIWLRERPDALVIWSKNDLVLKYNNQLWIKTRLDKFDLSHILYQGLHALSSIPHSTEWFEDLDKYDRRWYSSNFISDGFAEGGPPW